MILRVGFPTIAAEYKAEAWAIILVFYLNAFIMSGDFF